MGAEGFRFDLIKGRARGPRLGVLHTAHGDVETPVFMPVGTQATIKATSPEQAWHAGARLILANTYHLYLKPGHEVVSSLGGLHEFMGWSGPILTDSGGFQVFSLSSLRKIEEQGVTFRSHIDGSTHFISPEKSIEIQHSLGADIIMCFDECPPYPVTLEQARSSRARSARWAERCLAYHAGRVACRSGFNGEPSGTGEAGSGKRQALFGIVQGSVYEAERTASAREIAALDFDGCAIGGLSVGEPKEMMLSALEWSIDPLPERKPRYLMGVGTPEDIIQAVARGTDMFDSVLPTRIARHGAALTNRGRLLLKNAEFGDDGSPIEEGCDCYACREFSRGYIRHLFKAKEPLALTLATIHNLRFMANFMARLRDAIAADEFSGFAENFRGTYARRTGRKE
ncbi:MAG: tRNA guanosine(34) transglycosylase Tgt [Bacillota bacterium]|nr:tRNA guanosine(34) transglycosylase Tgt [Bacillota bacterium]